MNKRHEDKKAANAAKHQEHVFNAWCQFLDIQRQLVMARIEAMFLREYPGGKPSQYRIDEFYYTIGTEVVDAIRDDVFGAALDKAAEATGLHKRALINFLAAR